MKNLSNQKKSKKFFFFAGVDVVFFVQEDETIYSFGGDEFIKGPRNQRGYEMTKEEKRLEYRPSPLKSPLPCGIVIDIVSGRHHSLLIIQENRINHVYSVGRNVEGQLCLGYKGVEINELKNVARMQSKNIVRVFAGSIHSLFLTSSGEAFGVGWGRHGQIGFGKQQEDVIEPKRVLLDEKIEDIICGWSYSVFLTKSKEIYKAGCVCSENDCYLPMKIKISLSNKERIRSIRGVEYKFVVLGNKNTIWESNVNDGKNLKEVEDLSYLKNRSKFEIKDFNVSTRKTYILTTNGNVFVHNSKDEDDYEEDLNKFIKDMKGKVLKSGIQQIECGYFQAFFIADKSNVFCLGNNSAGDLGLGHDNKVEGIVKNNFITNLKRFKFTTPILLLVSQLSKENYIDIHIFCCN